MTTAFIIHGSYGNPEENWFPWLKKELEKIGCKVFIPKFPTPENQSLDSWMSVFEDYSRHIGDDTIVIGHSLGVAFLLNVLEKSEKPVKAAFFVAGFTGLLGNKTFDNINQTFTDRDFHWQKIRKKCRKFYIFNSDNDHYVPLGKGRDLAKNLGVKVIVVKDAGHFNEEAGYKKFDLILKEIRKELQH